MDHNSVAEALLRLSQSRAEHVEHLAQTQAQAAGLPLPQFVLSGTHPTRVLPHQFRELGITEGPSEISKFSTRKWTFHVQGTPMCLTVHMDTPQNVRKAVVNELEFLLRCAINKCLEDGAKSTDVLHLYLSAAGMDFNFVFYPAGQHAVTIADILKPNGLHLILEQFARLIQSGKNMFIKQKHSFVSVHLHTSQWRCETLLHGQYGKILEQNTFRRANHQPTRHHNLFL